MQARNGMYDDSTPELRADDVSIRDTNGQHTKEEVVKHSMIGTHTDFFFRFEIGYLSHKNDQIRVAWTLGSANLAIIRIFN